MQSVSSRIWTRVAVFISYDDNHYTTGNIGYSKNVHNKKMFFFKFIFNFFKNAHMIDWLILTECQFFKDYFMPKD